MMPADPLTQLRDGHLAGATRLDLSCELTEFPREIFDLADTLEVLNLTGNRLASLPDDLHRLRKLRILFCSDNLFTHLPEALGQCESLSMIGFRANQITTVSEASLPTSLRWLILTDNRITELPRSIGKCGPLQKLMLSGNRLLHLPTELGACENLEMIRLAANDFQSLPEWLLTMPKLAWLALAGNPCMAPATASGTNIPWAELTLLDKLGEGASGLIHRARWQRPSDLTAREVAIKIFKGSMTSDGLASSEIAASLTLGAHPHTIEVLGQITDQPGTSPALAMALIPPDFTALAGPPSMASCTRDVYAEEQIITLSEALRIATGLASAGTHLHQHGIMHGDFYAHNVLVNPNGRCLLGDFGAAVFYTSQHARYLQQIEVRAFGILLGELLARVAQTDHDNATFDALLELQARCCSPSTSARPLFEAIHALLSTLAQGAEEGAV